TSPAKVAWSVVLDSVSVVAIGWSSLPAALRWRLGRLDDHAPPVDAVPAPDRLHEDDAGPVGVELVGGPGRQQGHVAAPGLHPSHRRAARLAFHRDRALEVGRRLLALGQLAQRDLD